MTNREWLKQHPELEYFFKLVIPLIPFNNSFQKNFCFDKIKGLLDSEYTGDKK